MKPDPIGRELPLFEVEEHEDHYLVAVDLPGFPCPDMEIQIDRGQVLVHRSEKVNETEEGSSRVLFRSRSAVGHVQAVYDHGVLWVTLPKRTGLPSLKDVSAAAHKTTAPWG